MSVCMFKLRPIVNHDEPLPVPSHNMYTMKPVQEAARTQGQDKAPSSAATGSKGDMAALEGRQEDILKKLSKLRIDIEELRAILRQPSQVTASSLSTSSNVKCPPCPELGESRDIVVYASPKNPPYSLLGLARVWRASCPIQISNHTHSSVKEAPSAALTFVNEVTGVPNLKIILIWKEVPETELVINPIRHIAVRGETNILRFLSRVGPTDYAYEANSNLSQVALLDEVLDNCQRLARSKTVKEKQAIVRTFNASLGKSEWMCGQPKLSIIDTAVWSVLKQQGPSAALTQTLTKWMERCDSMLL
ncbi:aminoacyl tRNA synthase complex-interacting multifunctional protein 2 isoform X2 [Frankliniella occidentalis]|uniref:Aminoacyl tRNA synthase complex-interacting multifunctional protein 2 isoform X2 n=2 Tax=Frankliniella occidentalis TaxID=133901 RepID=A0A6J1STG5_FRAOC|nr:aminoacyl tRNA synthase complex-interacting multifunctional protein 2 isoform X2 [Frankliniella occidentalis]